MKKHLSILFILLLSMVHAQENTYQKLWQEVLALEKKGLPKSALEKATAIAKKATKEKQHTQFIKSLLYRGKYHMLLEENAQEKIIALFKKEIELQATPTKNILENVLASMYFSYYKNHSWQFANRTKTQDKNTDFKSWDTQTMLEEIHLHYQNALENPEFLQNQPLTDFDSILQIEPGSKTYRPTLFDFLQHNALDFYTSYEVQTPKSSSSFSLDKPEFLENIPAFLELDFSDKTFFSEKIEALKAYQNLLCLHENNKNWQALAMVNIERLLYVYENTNITDKQKRLKKRLEQAYKATKNTSAAALYHYEIANLLHQNARLYTPEQNTDMQWENKKAKTICDAIIKEFPKSLAAKKAKGLKARITESSIAITAENYIPTNQISKIKITHKNIGSVALFIYKASQKEFEKFSTLYKKEDKKQFLSKLPIAIQKKQALKNELDYQTHSSELDVAALPNGYYLIQLQTNTGIQAFGKIQSTNFALTQQKTPTQTIYRLIDRNHGAPIANAAINLQYKPNYRAKAITKNFTTDANGSFTMARDKNYSNIQIQASKNNHNASFGGYYSYAAYKEKSIKKALKKGFLFTDRAIYRPGQNLYFKAIVIQQKEKESRVLPNQKITISLMDANYQKVASIEKTTSSFGSVSGMFTLPKQGLTGNYQLKIEDTTNAQESGITSHISFLVENYKRPTFFTTFKDIDTQYRLEDTITVKAKATSYNATPITHAKVQYRVVRKTQYPIWCYWRYTPPQKDMVISQGTTTTDAHGAFHIPFTLLADKSVDPKNNPIFNYHIQASVTDINNETQSQSTIIKAAYQNIIAKIQAPKTLRDKNPFALKIQTTTLQGVAIKSNTHITIHKLQAPEKVLRKRPWSAPDYKAMDKKEFTAIFPFEAFNEEGQYKNWKKAALVFKDNHTTGGKTDSILVKTKNWKPGKYLITLEAKDKNQNIVKELFYLDYQDFNHDGAIDNAAFSIESDKDSYKVAEKASFKISSATALSVQVFIENKKGIRQVQQITLNNNVAYFSTIITEEDLGGFSIGYSTAYQNSFITGNYNIAVPHPNTDLRITTKTITDKLLPGSKQTWQVQIQNHKNQKAQAEVLASMYDASLDQFTPHTWHFLAREKSVFYPSSTIWAANNFNTQRFSSYPTKQITSYNHNQGFDALNWFGFYFGNAYQNRIQPLMASRKIRGKKTEAIAIEEEEEYVNNDADFGIQGAPVASTKNTKEIDTSITNMVRDNPRETAFFFADIKTDPKGVASFTFDAPQALTTWNMQILAHTKNASSAMQSYRVITQKPIMLQANMPRFFREKDTLVLRSKISNTTDKEITATAELIFIDAITKKEVSTDMMPVTKKSFRISKNANTVVSWDVSVMDRSALLDYEIRVKTKDHTDIEKGSITVLSNRKQITQTKAYTLQGAQQKTIRLTALEHLKDKELQNLIITSTTNPIWYAIEALPSISKPNYQASSAIVDAFYACALGHYIVKSNPSIENVLKTWEKDTSVKSPLEQNQELKNVALAHTPWLVDGQKQSQQKRQLANVLSLENTKKQQEALWKKLSALQFKNGSFPWFSGGRENRYATQHIISTLGRLYKLTNTKPDAKVVALLEKAIAYTDNAFVNTYQEDKKQRNTTLPYLQLHYLYARSFFNTITKNAEVKKTEKQYIGIAKKTWHTKSLYTKLLIALALEQQEKANTLTKNILTSLKEYSITNPELGMYWKENTSGYHWYNNAIATHSLAIEAFHSVPGYAKEVALLKTWLLKNKQTTHWENAMATTNAVYALCLQGDTAPRAMQMPQIYIGKNKEKVTPDTKNTDYGYFKKQFSKQEITADMANIHIQKLDKGLGWGAIYLQYTQDLDKITPNNGATGITLEQKCYKKQTNTSQMVLHPITKNTALQVGDIVVIKTIIKSDRAMEYMHLQNMHASGLEPIYSPSRYYWQDGLGYYKSIKDSSTDFYIEFLPKGVFVLEQELIINQTGVFSNGISSLQSLYAPEFSSYSKATTLKVE